MCMDAQRNLGCLAKLQDIKPGDILLFRSSRIPFKSQKVVMFFQMLLSLQRGHFDTIHAAVCVAIEDGQPVIAHSYEYQTSCKSHLGYIRQSLQSMLEFEGKDNPDNKDRSFLVFRYKDLAAALELAKVAGDEKANQHIKWTYTQAARTYFRPAFWGLNENRPISNNKKMPDTAICSQFVINAIKIAEQNRHHRGEKLSHRFTMRSISTPKALESYLYRDVKNFDLLCYPGKNAYWELLSAIRMQLKRIRNRSADALVQQKYQEGIRLYNKVRKQHKHKECKLNYLNKCQQLLKTMMPVLARHTGFSCFGLWNTTSYNIIRDKARQMGVFERDFRVSVGSVIG
jgi:hypothetical protein